MHLLCSAAEEKEEVLVVEEEEEEEFQLFAGFKHQGRLD